MLKYFHEPWDSVPVAVCDTETTGLRVGHDRACSVAIVRFEAGIVIEAAESLINPGIPIPTESTLIHGITDEQVKGMPTIEEWFSTEKVRNLIADAQPAAFNANFDRQYTPPFCEPWDWPWLDALSLVRKVDRYASGKGRHKLAACCERHGIVLENAHSAEADARAAGHLLFKLGRQMFPEKYTLGQALGWQRRIEAIEWERFAGWLSKQPPLESAAQ